MLTKYRKQGWWKSTRLSAQVDEVISFARVGRLADHDRHPVARGDLPYPCHALRIVAVYKTFGGDDEQLFIGIAVLCIGDHRRRRFQRALFALADDHAVESLERLQLSFDDVFIPLVGQNDKLVAERDIPQDGLLEHRTPLADLHKLFRVVLARQRPEPVAAAAR